jgi:hypothetical protein
MLSYHRGYIYIYIYIARGFSYLSGSFTYFFSRTGSRQFENEENDFCLVHEVQGRTLNGIVLTKIIISGENTFYPPEIFTYLRFNIQYLKSDKRYPQKVSNFNKKAHLFILTVTLDGDQVTCMTCDIFQPKNSKMPLGVKCNYKLLWESKI